MVKKMKPSVEVVTPEKARKWLEAAKRAGVTNRKVAQHYINLDAEAMRSGKWKENGETIKFDSDGIVMDGQHRLEACVLANTPFTTVIVRNIDRSAFDTIDCGKTRTCAQVLQMEQVPYHAVVASLIIARDAFNNERNVEDTRKVARSHQDVVDEYRRHPDEYVTAATVAVRHAKANILKPRVIGTLYYHLVYDRSQDAAFVENMFKSLTSLDTAKNSVFDKLRKLLYSYSTSGENISDRLKVTQIAMAWNAVAHGSKAPRFSRTDADTHDIQFDDMPLTLF